MQWKLHSHAAVGMNDCRSNSNCVHYRLIRLVENGSPIVRFKILPDGSHWALNSSLAARQLEIPLTETNRQKYLFDVRRSQDGGISPIVPGIG